MTEEWRDIEGYEGLYQVSNLGRVKSVERTIINTKGVLKHVKERILKQGIINSGYVKVDLCKNGKYDTKTVHRLVAKAFIPNPDNLPEVNHINETKTDNRCANLSWISRIENVHHGTGLKRNGELHSHWVICIETQKKYKSMKEACADVGIKTSSNIRVCCRNPHRTAGGYHWKYAS